MAGCNLAVPFLILNLGGEMFYVLDQRLNAQSISVERGAKVRQDIVKNLCAGNFVTELFKPQGLYSLQSTRQVFDKLAHCSIMKLHSSSMNKLFDLMLMGVKMQFMCVTHPKELVNVTINHLNSIKNMVQGTPSEALVERTIEMFEQKYSYINHAVFYRIRNTVLNFFQEKQTKVSLFMNKQIQNSDGTMNICGEAGAPEAQRPGNIEKISPTGEILRKIRLNVRLTDKFVEHRTEGTLLGLNLYSRKMVVEEEKKEAAINTPDPQEIHRENIAKWELNSLAGMIGGENSGDSIQIEVLGKDISTLSIEHSRSEVVGVAKNEKMEQFRKELDSEEVRNREKTEEDELLDLL